MISALLILLFVYTAVSKLLDMQAFREQMYNQEFPAWLADLLITTLPALEIVTAVLILFQRTRLTGLMISFLLMVLFTTYILLVIAGYYDRTPCSCGGVLRSMGWTTHLLFNLFFTLISFLGIRWSIRERRSPQI
ncbi:MauE/DoxX family redox-associated membrane protein [Mucilaginibacter myungsuensis]